MPNLMKIVLIAACIIAAEAHIEFPIATDHDEIAPKINVLNNEVKEDVKYRLPTNVVPEKYTLVLTPHIDVKGALNNTFDGEVKIDVTVKKDGADKIVLHSQNLEFTYNGIVVEDSKGTGIQGLTLEFDKERDFAIITPKTKFSEGAYTIKINYKGVLNNTMRGFYRSSYVNDKNERVWLATTHFEPVGARQAFPCFDEPALKATFDLSIICDKKYTAIANTPVKGNPVESKDKKTFTFETTPVMSTYLLAFVVSDFELLTNKGNVSKGDTVFNVYARPNAVEHGKLALEKGPKLLKELEKFTGKKFPIAKMDQAAIPDFAAGAMENWGLVLYREKSLLYDDKVLTTSEKQNIVETIAHEFAHQWFGNLVSPTWWKYIWLNEGFANFFQSYITEKIEPKWRSIDQSVVKSIQTTAFSFDSGSTTHPINHDVESPAEIGALFDSISYQKGGAVIRMMQHFLTEPVFQKGLQKYLETKAYSAADSDDLFKAISDAAKDAKVSIDVKFIMDAWVNKKGYPVVNVIRNYDSKTVQFAQERFYTYKPTEEEKKNPTLWKIPINYATIANPNFNDTKPDFWLDDASKNESVQVEPKQWLIVNKQQTGYYRVNYDEKNWNLIIEYLNSGSFANIHTLNRAQLINDALAFAQQDTLRLNTVLHLTEHLTNDTDYITWYPTFKVFSWLNGKLINTNYYSTFKSYVLNTTKHLVESVGIEEHQNDDHLTKLNRISALNWACSFGDAQCVTQMQIKMEQWLNGTTKISLSPDLKKVTFCHGLQKVPHDIWYAAFNKTADTKNNEEKGTLIEALGCSTVKQNLEAFLNDSVADNSRIGNTYAVIKSVIENNDIGVDVTLDFIVRRFISVYRKIKDENRIASLFNSIGQRVTTSVQYNKLKKTEETDIPKSITERSIKLAESNLKWLQDNEDEIVTWIKDVTKTNANSGVGIFSASFGLITSLLVMIFAAAQ